MTDKQGVTRRYTTADFDEFFTTTEEHVMHQHMVIGWLLLEESMLPGAGPGHMELRLQPVSAGGYGGPRLRKVPVQVPDGLPSYLLGHLREGAVGELV